MPVFTFEQLSTVSNAPSVSDCPSTTTIVVPLALVLDTVLLTELCTTVHDVLLPLSNIQLLGNGPISILSPEISPFDNLLIVVTSVVTDPALLSLGTIDFVVLPNVFGTIALRTPLDVVSRTSSDELFVLIPIDDMALAS